MSSEDPYPLTPCTTDDISAIYETYLAAFSPSDITKLLYPEGQVDEAARRAWFDARVLKQLRQPELRYFKITEAATGEVAAIVRWGFPHVRAPKKKEEGEKSEEQKLEEMKSEWPRGTNLALADAKFGQLDVWRERFIDWENTYVAYLLATKPQYHRKGFGTRLLCVGLDLADREGKRAYIEATPEGFPLYRRLGFREIDRMSVGLEPFGGVEGSVGVNYCMVREPGGRE